LQAKIETWRDRRFLNKHGCENWEQYNYRFDPDRCQWASRVKDYYHGYPYWTIFSDHSHQVYYWDLGVDGIYILSEWCKQNLSGKFRFDFLRVFEQTPYGLNGPEDAEWWINEIGGSDYIFFACQNEQDFLMFNLRWA
jgi:hypothetical protein